MTLHAYEMAALISTARWAVDGCEGDLSSEAREHLRQVLANYDRALTRVGEVGSGRD